MGIGGGGSERGRCLCLGVWGKNKEATTVSLLTPLACCHPSPQVRKLSEEREWLATQLEQGPPPDLPAQKVLRGGGAGSKPLKRHVSF